MGEGRLTKFLFLLPILMDLSNGLNNKIGDKDTGIRELNFLLLLSFEIEGSSEQPWFSEGPILQPAAELAVEQINQRDDILADYSVNLTVANSACNLKLHTIVNFVKTFFYSGLKFPGIVGPLCSDAVKLISPITRQEDVSVLNFHIGSSEQFTDRNRFRYAFSTVSSTNPIMKLVVYLMKDNKWDSVAVLYDQHTTVFLNAYDLLVKELPRVYPQGKISFSVSVSDDSLFLSPILHQHLRVVIVLCPPSLARKIMCLIQRQFHQLTFPAFQFIILGVDYPFFQSHVSFTFNHNDYECSAKEITQVMEGFLLTDLELHVANSTELDSGVTYTEYLHEYKEAVNGSTTDYANALYDGVWSLALALNNSIPRLNEIGLDLVNYTYGHREATDIIRDEVLKLSFQGASGHISFRRDNGFTSGSIPLYQIVDNYSILVGYYDEDKDELDLSKDANFIKSSFQSMELVVNPTLASFFLLSFLLVLAIIISTHVATLVHRRFPAIRASSYRLGQLAFIGCYLIVFCFLCFTIEKVAPSTSVDTTSLCVIQAWCLPLGLTLILGTVTAKTWRLYRIFVHLNKPGKFLRDWLLIVVVILLATVDIILCSVWTAKFRFYTLDHEVIAENIMIQVRVECHSDYYHAWFGALSLYQGLIMVSALVFAFLTKNIRHKSFKTKSVILLVYFLTITLSLGFPLYLILSTARVSGVDVEYVVLSLTYLAVVCLCFVFLFFPPILSLLRVKAFHKIPGLKRYSKKVKTKPYQPSSITVMSKT